jgi:hypothetical protein
MASDDRCRRARCALRRAATALAVMSMLATFPRAVAAQTAADRETARGLMDDGFAQRDRGDHKGALERFEAADVLMHVPTTGIEVARERAYLGRLVEARDALAAVVRHPQRVGEPAPFTDARVQAKKLDEELAARIPSLNISLRGADAAALLTVDGVDVPVAALVAPRKLNPGTHTIVLRSGGREKSEHVTLRERETKELALDVTAPPTPTPTRTPRTGGDEGAHHEEEEMSSFPKFLIYSGFGTAGAGVIVGTIAGIASFSYTSAARHGCNGNECPPRTYGDIDAAKSAGAVATVAFVIGGAGLVLGVIGVFTNKSGAEKHEKKERNESAEARRTRVTPWLAPSRRGGGATAGIAGAF